MLTKSHLLDTTRLLGTLEYKLRHFSVAIKSIQIMVSLHEENHKIRILTIYSI